VVWAGAAAAALAAGADRPDFSRADLTSGPARRVGRLLLSSDVEFRLVGQRPVLESVAVNSGVFGRVVSCFCEI